MNVSSTTVTGVEHWTHKGEVRLFLWEKFVGSPGNKPAVLFFTMSGIHALLGPPPPLEGWERDAINKQRGVGDFETLLQACVELGVHFIVCEMGLRSLAIDRTKLRADLPFTVAGIVTLLEETKPGMHLLEIS